MIKRRNQKNYDPMNEVRRDIRMYRTQSGKWKLRLSKAEASLARITESITWHTAMLERITDQLPQMDALINGLQTSPLRTGMEIKREKMLAQQQESENILAEAIPQQEILSRLCAGYRLEIQGFEMGLTFYTNKLADYEARQGSESRAA